MKKRKRTRQAKLAAMTELQLAAMRAVATMPVVSMTRGYDKKVVFTVIRLEAKPALNYDGKK